MPMHTLPSRCRAITLIELMVVVAIVGILASIAYPSYQEHLRKGHRAAAQSYLMDQASRQQQFLIDNRSYSANVLAPVPAEVDRYYSITVAAVAGPPPTFTLTATPKAGTTQVPDGALTINHVGVKTPSNKW